VSCHNCGDPCYRGPRPFQVDTWVCRGCQRNPNIQVRVLLARARVLGFGFEQAWVWALGKLVWKTRPDDPSEPQAEFQGGKMRWPHDTPERLEWKNVFADEGTKAGWRDAFNRVPPKRTEEPLKVLIAA
jgi:hypothetical protein